MQEVKMTSTKMILSLVTVTSFWICCSSQTRKGSIGEECMVIPEYSPYSFQIVQSCPETFEDPTAYKCYNADVNPIAKIPVTNTLTGITFRNIFCAICHGEYSNITRWQLHMTCDEALSFASFSNPGNLKCDGVLLKPPMAKLKPCRQREKRKRRAATGQKDRTVHAFGYSTLLNFAADGTKHILLTSDAEEYLSRAKCEKGQIFQPFTQQCLSAECLKNDDSNGHNCIDKDVTLQDQENICMDFYISYKIADDLPEPIGQEDFKLTVVKTLIENFDFSPQNIILPNNLFDNTSQCLEPKGFMASYMMWNSTNLDDFLSKKLKYDIKATQKINATHHLHCQGPQSRQGTQSLSKVVFSLKFTGMNSELRNLNETLKAQQYEKAVNFSSFAITYQGNNSDSKLAGSGCIYDMDVHNLEESWCQGLEQKYFDDQFTVNFDTKGTDIVSVYINQTGKTYRKSEFQYTAVLDGPFWGDIKQLVSTCTIYPKIIQTNLTSCVPIPLNSDDYMLMANRSIHIPAFEALSSVPMPFETEARADLQSVYNLSEYQYLIYDSQSANLADILNGLTKPNVSVCVPQSLLQLAIEIDLWDKIKVSQSCSYLQNFGHGSSIAGVVCSAISMVAMIFTLATYSIFRSLRTLPGVSLMNLTIALMLSQLMFHVGLLVPKDWEDKHYVCFSMAVLTHYFTLASFTWMNVMAYNSYRAFGAKLKTRLMQLNKKHLVFNTLYGWGLPAVVVLICALVDYAYRKKQYIGYGLVAAVKVIDERDDKTGNIDEIKLNFRKTSTCWIGNNQAAVMIFGIPLFFCMVVNLALFLKTCWGMREKKTVGRPRTILRRDSGSGSLKERSEMSIHCRLSAQYGFAWLIAIAIVLLGTSRVDTVAVCYILYILNLLFNILNGLAGSFIFFAFVFNKRIWHLYKAKFGSQKNSRFRQSSVFQISRSRMTSTGSLPETISPPESPFAITAEVNNNDFPMTITNSSSARYFADTDEQVEGDVVDNEYTHSHSDSGIYSQIGENYEHVTRSNSTNR